MKRNDVMYVLNSKLGLLAAAIASLALVSCASSSPDMTGAANLNMVTASEFPTPTLDDLSASDRPYRV